MFPISLKGSSILLVVLSLSYEGWVFRSDYFSQRQSLDSVEALIQMLMMAGFNTDDVLVKEGDKYKARTIILLGKEWTSLRVFPDRFWGATSAAGTSSCQLSELSLKAFGRITEVEVRSA